MVMQDPIIRVSSPVPAASVAVKLHPLNRRPGRTEDGEGRGRLF
jgi:hypothetical protein